MKDHEQQKNYSPNGYSLEYNARPQIEKIKGTPFQTPDGLIGKTLTGDQAKINELITETNELREIVAKLNDHYINLWSYWEVFEKVKKKTEIPDPRSAPVDTLNQSV